MFLALRQTLKTCMLRLYVAFRFFVRSGAAFQPVAAREALRALKPRAAPWRRVEGRRGSMVDIVSWLQLNSQVRSQGQKAVERVGRPLFFPCNATSILLVVYGSEP